jgi:hypothetical protein
VKKPRGLTVFGFVCLFGFALSAYADEQGITKLKEEIGESQKRSQQAKELQNEIKKKAEEHAERQFILSALGTVSLETMAVLKAVGVADKVVYIGELLRFKRDLRTLDPSFDSSKQADYTPQQQLTPINISFTTSFDGFFTQAADSPGSQGGDHLGTITTGTRIGAGSRSGDFTGSFSGRTIAETGYTPATYSNQPFSGTSVGTATAKGFQEGELKGSMSVTVPAGTQTTTVSGSITINTDGSLSMPSYSGPVTVVATGEKVGTMSGSWNQGATH